MSAPRARRRVAARPFTWIGKGIGRGAKGVWRVVRRSRREPSLPMASLTASLVDNRLETASDLSSEWCNQADEPLFQFPDLSQLQLPSWLTSALAGWQSAVNDSNSSNKDFSSSNQSVDQFGTTTWPPAATTSNTGGDGSHNSSSSNNIYATVAAASTAATACQCSTASSSSGVQVLGQMLSTDNSFPMLLQPITTSSGSSSQTDSNGNCLDQSQQVSLADDSLCASGSSNSGRSGSNHGSGQQLLTVGTRHWGNWWDGRGLLKVKIYDFALYVDGQQASLYLPSLCNNSRLQLLDQLQQPDQPPQRPPQPPPPAQQPDLPAHVKAHDSGVGMSLILKASREVPLYLLQEEYEKVLKRRLARAGGDAGDDAALKQLLSGLGDPQRLPSAVCRGPDNNNVAKGAMIVFERTSDGAVAARIGSHVLDVVHSPKLSEALFDLYLGDQPVSKTAKEAAAEVLQRMSSMHGQQPYYLPKSSKEVIMCQGAHGGGDKVVGRTTSLQGSRLSVSDLAACALHMGQ